MKSRAEVIKYCLTFSETFEDYPFHDNNWTCMRIRSTNRIFAWIYEREEHIWVNVKCDPEWTAFWRNAFDSVVPAYHLNKSYWNSIILDGNVPDKEIRIMIGNSYDLTVKKRKKG